MPPNRLLAIFDHFLNPVAPATPMTPGTPNLWYKTNCVGRSLLDALEKHLGYVNSTSPRVMPSRPLRLRNQVPVTGEIARVFVSLGQQAIAAAHWKIPSSISELLRAIGNNLEKMADGNRIVNESLLHTCVFLASFIADKYEPKDDEKDIKKNLEGILKRLLTIPSAQQPIAFAAVPPTPPAVPVRSDLGLLGEQIRDTYWRRSPAMYHPQLPPASPCIQNSTLSPTSTSSDPPSPETQLNEPHMELFQYTIVDPSDDTNNEDGHNILDHPGVTSNTNSLPLLGLFYPHEPIDTI
jgi:hypothetical protein